MIPSPCRYQQTVAIMIQSDLPIRILKNAVITPARANHQSHEIWGNVFNDRGQIVTDLTRKAGRWVHALEDPPTGKDIRHIPAAIFAGHMHTHYGHCLIESIPSAIVAKRVRDAEGRLPVIYHDFNGSPRADLPPDNFRTQILKDCFDIDVNDVIFSTTTLKVNTLYTFEPPVQLRGPVIRSDFHGEFVAGRDRLLEKAGYAPNPCQTEMIYISRQTDAASRSHRRKGSFVEQEQYFEDALTQLGVRIIIPEEMTYTDQLDLFARTKVLIGLTGSGLHNALWCQAGTQVLEIASTPANIDIMRRIAEAANADFCKIPFGTAVVKKGSDDDWYPAFDIDKAIEQIKALLD